MWFIYIRKQWDGFKAPSLLIRANAIPDRRNLSSCIQHAALSICLLMVLLLKTLVSYVSPIFQNSNNLNGTTSARTCRDSVCRTSKTISNVACCPVLCCHPGRLTTGTSVGNGCLQRIPQQFDHYWDKLSWKYRTRIWNILPVFWLWPHELYYYFLAECLLFRIH